MRLRRAEGGQAGIIGDVTDIGERKNSDRLDRGHTMCCSSEVRHAAEAYCNKTKDCVSVELRLF